MEKKPLIFSASLTNASLKLMNADRTFFKNPDLLFFSTIENGKISVSSKLLHVR
jgi:hypothetical protein